MGEVHKLAEMGWVGPHLSVLCMCVQCAVGEHPSGVLGSVV